MRANARQTGLTVIEITIVLTLVALLLLLGLPLMKKTYHEKLQTTCMLNLKQLGLTFKMYANESVSGLYPSARFSQGLRSTERKLQWKFDAYAFYPEYLVDLELLVCPTDSDGAKELADMEQECGQDYSTYSECINGFDLPTYTYMPWESNNQVVFGENNPKLPTSLNTLTPQQALDNGYYNQEYFQGLQALKAFVEDDTNTDETVAQHFREDLTLENPDHKVRRVREFIVRGSAPPTYDPDFVVDDPIMATMFTTNYWEAIGQPQNITPILFDPAPYNGEPYAHGNSSIAILFMDGHAECNNPSFPQVIHLYRMLEVL